VEGSSREIAFKTKSISNPSI